MKEGVRVFRSLGLAVALAGALPVAVLPALSADTGAAPAPALATASADGATALRETYDDWTVVCAATPSGKTCAMQQELRIKENNQRVLAIELRPAGTGAEGALVLPFGLALDKGATLQIDDGAAGAPLTFRTCVPAGCVAPVSINARMLANLRKGAALKVKVTPDGGGAAMQWPVSLKGFSAAFDRTAAMVK
jgi:invasion protein IalB